MTAIPLLFFATVGWKMLHIDFYSPGSLVYTNLFTSGALGIVSRIHNFLCSDSIDDSRFKGYAFCLSSIYVTSMDVVMFHIFLSFFILPVFSFIQMGTILTCEHGIDQEDAGTCKFCLHIASFELFLYRIPGKYIYMFTYLN